MCQLNHWKILDKTDKVNSQVTKRGKNESIETPRIGDEIPIESTLTLCLNISCQEITTTLEWAQPTHITEMVEFSTRSQVKVGIRRSN